MDVYQTPLVGLDSLTLAEHTNNTHTADRANKKMTSGLITEQVYVSSRMVVHDVDVYDAAMPASDISAQDSHVSSSCLQCISHIWRCYTGHSQHLVSHTSSLLNLRRSENVRCCGYRCVSPSPQKCAWPRDVIRTRFAVGSAVTSNEHATIPDFQAIVSYWCINQWQL